MPKRYLLSIVLGSVLVFSWGGFAWAGGLYDRFMRPMPGGEAVVKAMDAAAPASGMYVHPAPLPETPGASAQERAAMEQARMEQFHAGPLIMMAFTKGPKESDPARMFTRGFLVEFFATAMLVAAVGLAGAGHGRLRRFLALQAMVAFMALATHMVSWAFMDTPNEWTAVLVFDSWVGWTLAGLPAVFLMRSMRPGDTSAA